MKNTQHIFKCFVMCPTFGLQVSTNSAKLSESENRWHNYYVYEEVLIVLNRDNMHMYFHMMGDNFIYVH